MVNDDLVKCPLCGGFTHVGRPELVAALNDPEIRRQVESLLAQLLAPERKQLASVGSVKERSTDFSKDVHNWNPNMPVWRRSPKE